jgi:UDP-N-acetylmuramoyl-tripeptide--D-alanyl-D-alanine ligase
VIPLHTDEVEALLRPDDTFERFAERVTGVKIDSRLIEPGDLFVAVGDGESFLGDARARGAAATLVSGDPFAALATLGKTVRGRSEARVVAVTGSTGKTSTKDILHALCAPVVRTVAAEASFNNELGVPLTLCRLEPGTEVCIVELAMRGFGQIAELAAVARPDIGVVTGVGPVHLELVGTVAGVARAKAELIESLPSGGIAVVPRDAPELEPHLRRPALGLRRFSADDVLSADVEGDRTHAAFSLEGREVALTLNVVARHQLVNALAALHAYDALGLPLDRVQEGAESIAFSRWRGDEIPLEGGGLLINDAYNANPVSMRAALDHLVARAGSRRRVAVLGDMAELGPDAERYHEDVGRHAASVGVDVLVAVGPLARRYVQHRDEIPAVLSVADVDEATASLDELVQPGDCVLVKASRAMGLERVAEAIAGARV